MEGFGKKNVDNGRKGKDGRGALDMVKRKRNRNG